MSEKEGVSTTATLGFWRDDFDLFRRLVDRVPWGVLKGKDVQEDWKCFQKENLKDVGIGCTHVPKDEPMGKETSLAELWLRLL